MADDEKTGRPTPSDESPVDDLPAELAETDKPIPATTRPKKKSVLAEDSVGVAASTRPKKAGAVEKKDHATPKQHHAKLGLRRPRGFAESMGCFFHNYGVFSGRSNLGEFWWPALFNVIVGLILAGVAVGVVGPTALSKAATYKHPGTPLLVIAGIFAAFCLLMLLPSLAVAVRRLHDTHRSGLFIFLNLIPVIGSIVLLVLYAKKSVPAGEKFGAEVLVPGHPTQDAEAKVGPVQFVNQCIAELRQVVWPTGDQLSQYFVVVLIFVLFIIAYVGLLDLGLGALLMKLLA